MFQLMHDIVVIPGRTARIGNTGLATSFYNEKNADLGSSLVKILLETKQPIPDFLEVHVPTGDAEGAPPTLDFDDKSEHHSEPSEDEDGDAARQPTETEKVQGEPAMDLSKDDGPVNTTVVSASAIRVLEDEVKVTVTPPFAVTW